MINIIVLTHNALEYTKKCLESIILNTVNDYEIIIIDNASTDGTQDWLKTTGYTYKLNKTNLGVAGGRNQGIKLSKGEYICFIDNDSTVGEGWDSKLMEVFATRPKAGLVGRMGANWKAFEYYGNNPIEAQNYPTETQIVCGGACQIFKRSLVDEIGYLDESLNPFWHEDSEFSLRAEIAGYKNYIIRFNWVHEDGGHKSGAEQAENLQDPNSQYMRNLKYIEQKIKDPMFVYRNLHQNCSESLCIMTDNLVEQLRKSKVVIRRPSIYSDNKSFDLHNGFVMEYKGKRIGYIHCENDRPAESWKEIDKLFDYYFPASYSVRNALIKGGFDKKKFFYSSVNGLQPEFNFDVKPTLLYPSLFKFFHYGATQPRKYTDGLIKAYCEAFTAKDNVILIIKDYKYGHKDWTENLIKEARQNPDCPQIEYIYEDWNTDKLASVLKTVADNGAYIHPHRAEGFGLPVLEALACGCRVGTTGFGGVLDFASRDATLFDYKLVLSTFHKNDDEQYYQEYETPLWAEPDQQSIIDWMHKIVTEKYNYDDRKAVSLSLQNKYNFESVAQRINKELENIGKPIFDEDYYNEDYWSGKNSSYNNYTECEVHKWDAQALFDTFDLKDKKCLDLGSCFGYQVKYLNQLGANAYGCDISRFAVEHAYDTSRITWADLEDELPYPDNSFDFVYSISVTEHLSYMGLDNLINEIKRILKPDGCFFNSAGLITQKEFFNDKSHQIQEKYNWWRNKMSAIGPEDLVKKEHFESISKSTKLWAWQVNVNRNIK